MSEKQLKQRKSAKSPEKQVQPPKLICTCGNCVCTVFCDHLYMYSVAVTVFLYLYNLLVTRLYFGLTWGTLIRGVSPQCDPHAATIPIYVYVLLFSVNVCVVYVNCINYLKQLNNRCTVLINEGIIMSSIWYNCEYSGYNDISNNYQL